MLKSHPNRSLQQHVDEVREAANKILRSHSETLRQNSAFFDDWVWWAVALHDAGKGTAAFQQYIAAPNKYRGSKTAKAHTPLSALVALKTGEHQSWDWRKTLCVANCAASHHSRFKTAAELCQYWLNNTWQETLGEQVDSLNWQHLSEALRCELKSFDVDVGILEEIGFELEETIVEEKLHELPVDAGVRFRLQCQFVHSVLLEADKAFLIIDESERSQFRRHKQRKLTPAIVDEHIAGFSGEAKLDPIRREIRTRLNNRLNQSLEVSKIETMTLPTGSGKTLLAASWLLHHRKRLQTNSHTPPAIIVLPFLSIIDQTQEEYLKMLPHDAGLIAYHSLSVREHADTESDDIAEFFLDTWHGDVIITTFDQFLLALLEARTKHQMRFHQLADALIVMDEVQALPFRLWDIVHRCLNELVRLGNGRVLAMSATQPGFLPKATPLIENTKSIFEQLTRYEIRLSHQNRVYIEDFAKELFKRICDWDGGRILIVLNTRKSARFVRDYLTDNGIGILFLTADITPMDRLKSIRAIKEGNPCVVVATQCVEAGVDIDMTHVIRDFAPLDSIVQVAGRCNRNANRKTEIVEVVDLVNENGRRYSEMIYDIVLLQATRKILSEFTKHSGSTIPEKEILKLTTDYFSLASDPASGKATGSEITTKFARWEDFGSVHELLRGQQGCQISFVVIEQDRKLENSLEEASLIENRWDKRRAIRKLSHQLAQITVSIYANPEINPEYFARFDATGNFLLLQSNYYDSERGIDLEGHETTEESTWGTCI